MLGKLASRTVVAVPQQQKYTCDSKLYNLLPQPENENFKTKFLLFFNEYNVGIPDTSKSPCIFSLLIQLVKLKCISSTISKVIYGRKQNKKMCILFRARLISRIFYSKPKVQDLHYNNSSFRCIFAINLCYCQFTYCKQKCNLLLLTNGILILLFNRHFTFKINAYCTSVLDDN